MPSRNWGQGGQAQFAPKTPQSEPVPENAQTGHGVSSLHWMLGRDILRLLGDVAVAAVRAAVVFVLGDQYHVVPFRAATGGVVGRGSGVVGADVDADGHAARVE